MALINKRNQDLAYDGWPNPYNLSKKDLQGWLKNVPLEILNLMLKEAKKQRDERYNLINLLKDRLRGAFDWWSSKESHEFWSDIEDENYQVFYDRYTPETLRKRLELNE